MDPNIQRLLDVIASSQAQSALNETVQRQSPPSTNNATIRRGRSSDPSSISTWPAALQYVMRQINVNDEILDRLCKLLQNQQVHEEQWWKGRQEIVQAYADRRNSRARIDATVSKLCVQQEGLNDRFEREESLELTRYEKKVYEASREMANDIQKALADLGIPFFCGRHPQNEELRANRAKMIALLEDLCRPES